MAIIASKIQEIEMTKIAARGARWAFCNLKEIESNQKKKHMLLVTVTYPLLMFTALRYVTRHTWERIQKTVNYLKPSFRLDLKKKSYGNINIF